MYKAFIRPVLFLFSPETVHHWVVFFVKFFCKIPGVAAFIRLLYTIRDPRLQRTLFGLTFNNPVGLAAGFDKNAGFYNDISNFGFAFVEIGTVTPKGQPGNPKPRSFRLVQDNALINRMGFNNMGVVEAAKKLDKKHRVIIGGNIGKNTLTPNEEAVNDYVTCFEELFPYVDYFVVNVSCPNISDLSKLQDKDTLLEIMRALQERNTKKESPKPILLKISPDLNYSQIDDVIEIVKLTKTAGIVATNTTIQRTGLLTPDEKVASIGNGGLSGKPITQTSTQIIRYIHEKTEGKLPIIGVGGIMNAQDAWEKIQAGASLVQVYTGFIYEGPALARKINQRILQNSR